MATISCEDSGFGDVDSVGVVEINFMFVINGCVVGIGKLATTEECLVQVGYNVHGVGSVCTSRRSHACVVAEGVVPMGSMKVLVDHVFV